MMTATEVTTSTGGIAIAYDYSDFYERIATALETIATTSTQIASSLQSIAGTLSSVDVTLTAIADDVRIITTQSTGTGIHTVGAHDWMGYMALYRLFIEEGKILDTSTYVSTSSTAEALTAVEEYVQKINDLPTSF